MQGTAFRADDREALGVVKCVIAPDIKAVIRPLICIYIYPPTPCISKYLPKTFDPFSIAYFIRHCLSNRLDL